MGVELISSEEYKNAHPGTLDAICNGCGSSGWKGSIVPDRILGVDISRACDIHDFDYWMGGTVDQRKRADLRFLVNMNRLIEERTSFWSRRFFNPLRMWLAQLYYEDVRKHGRQHFESDPQPDTDATN